MFYCSKTPFVIIFITILYIWQVWTSQNMYKSVSPSSQSSSKFHHTCSHPIIVILFSLRIIILFQNSLSFVVLHHSSSKLCRSLSFLVHSLSSFIAVMYLHSVGVDLERQVTLPSTLILPFIVLVFIGDSVIYALAGISFWSLLRR